ncbi:unnamed protein product [Hyaloperonospora brassicae]|uniref:SAP domain-containing protein n=1 Tax=Hyaloperonospora brassicae TaxID=162125 RepID=A0AAV0UJN6_HYABA|nr:unnamed protein product [Hyaloperonospora brassicae]
MVDQVESADERALRRELLALAKKREALINSKRQGGKAKTTGRGAAARGSVFARLGEKTTRGARQAFERTDRNNTRGNASWRLGKRDNDDNARPLGKAVKRQKLHSAVARPEGTGHLVVRAETSREATTSPSSDAARAQERKQRAVAPYAQKDGIARSRRMFGALMGHLGKAKRQIEKDTDLFKRQDTKQHEAEEKERAQSKNLEDQARQEAEVARLEALVARTELDRSEQIARAKLEHLQMIRKSERQSKFLVTIASPPINYLPAKHTKETQELVAASMEAHEAKIKASEQSHEENLRKMEAEFATKLKQLREDLKAIKKHGVEETADRHATSEKEEDAMDEGDLDMDEGSREPEEVVERGQERASEHSDGSPAAVVDNKDTVEQRASDNEADESAEPMSAAEEDDRRSPVRLEVREESGRSASRQANADGPVVDHSDAEASSPSRVNEEDKAVELAQESSKQKTDEPVRVSVSNESETAEAAMNEQAKSTSQSGMAAKTADDDEVRAAVNVDKLKVIELRAKLKERGLDTKGFKAALVQRLKQAMQDDDDAK